MDYQFFYINLEHRKDRNQKMIQRLKSNNLNKKLLRKIIFKDPKQKKFLEDLFDKKTRLTLESLISQIITKFVITRDNPCYGLSNLFTRKSPDAPVEPIPKRKIKSFLKNGNLHQEKACQ